MTHGCLEKSNGFGKTVLIFLTKETFPNTEQSSMFLRYGTQQV